MKSIQIAYRLYYLVRNKWRKIIGHSYNWNLIHDINIDISRMEYSIGLENCYNGGTFKFLNLTHKFNERIDWNFNDYGKLWTYNLNYFDFLNQHNIDKKEALNLMYDFISNISICKDGLEPFPISLRLMNWMKFIVNNDIQDKIILSSLYSQATILEENIEYHLLGNHLLENLFTLVSYSSFVGDENKFFKYKKVLEYQLEEQILSDGGHFELSPMYHQIMLFRLFDTINFLSNSNFLGDNHILFLKTKAAKMLGWLNLITFEDGSIPLLNDSANGIAPSTKELKEYAFRLEIVEKNRSLSSSGYRVFRSGIKEIIVDIGKIGPDYIPGHAHSDTLSFVIQYDGKPFIVDTGLSTYEICDARNYERSTEAHNTVVVNNTNQSQVWGGFRIAKRAKVKIIEEKENHILASHDGYKMMGITHKRGFKVVDNKFIIEDLVDGINDSTNIAFLHFHPDVKAEINEGVVKTNLGEITIDNFKSITLEKYNYSPEFNKRTESNVLKVEFDKKLKITIT